MKILLLGGTGYIGRFLGEYLELSGHIVNSVGRFTKNKFVIENGFDKNILGDTEIVIYLSWFFDTTDKNYENYNVKALKEVLEACKRKKTKLIFASTAYASTEAISKYNKTKGHCEKLVLKYNQQIVRFGAVYIGNNTAIGFYEKINTFCEKFKIFPKILPEKESFYKTGANHLKYLSKNINNFENQIFICMEKEGVSLINLFDLQQKVMYIPIHWKLVYIFLKISEYFKIDTGFRSDSVLSIWADDVESNKN